MKNILFATTAVSVALVAQSAFADVTNGNGAITVEVTGNVRFEAGIVLDEDNDDVFEPDDPAHEFEDATSSTNGNLGTITVPAERRDVERDAAFRTDAVLQFNISGENEAGLRYGAEIELDNVAIDDGVAVDELYMFVGGNWGQLRFGDKEGVINTLNDGGPGGVGSDGFDGNYGNYLINGSAEYSLDGITSGDDTRITYLSPDIEFGSITLNAGLSYAPSNNAGAKGGDTGESRVDGDKNNLFDVGASIGGEAGSFSYNASAAYAFADNNADGEDNHTGYRLGLDVAFGLGSGELGAAVGYYSDDDNKVETSSLWGSVSYEIGSFTVGANAVSTDQDNKADESAYGFGVSYDIANGLDAYSDVTFADKGNDQEGSVALAGIRVSF